jgi:hypothetical protein
MATEFLEHALTEAAKLPEGDQRAPADWALLELQSARRRRETFATSQRELGRLAEEAQAEFHAGETRPLEFAGCKPCLLVTCTVADTKNDPLRLWGAYR